jgi:hypothetical protein
MSACLPRRGENNEVTSWSTTARSSPITPDEGGYLGYNSQTGALIPGPTHNTATGFYGQVIADRTWNGDTSSSWSAPVADVTGLPESIGDGESEIGGGRAGVPLQRWEPDPPASGYHVEYDKGRDMGDRGRPGGVTEIETV